MRIDLRLYPHAHELVTQLVGFARGLLKAHGLEQGLGTGVGVNEAQFLEIAALNRIDTGSNRDETGRPGIGLSDFFGLSI